jgi:hypothetical protein
MCQLEEASQKLKEENAEIRSENSKLLMKFDSTKAQLVKLESGLVSTKTQLVEAAIKAIYNLLA